MILFGCFILLIFVFLSRAELVLLGKSAQGKVVALRTWGRAGRYVDPIIEYTDGYSVQTFRGESNLGYDVGSLVPVRYLAAENPHAVIYTFFGCWIAPLLYSVIPLVLLLAAGLSFFRSDTLFVFQLNKPVGVKIIKSNAEHMEEQTGEQREAEIREKAYQRMKSGKRRR
jgi:hypothetical protein